MSQEVAVNIENKLERDAQIRDRVDRKMREAEEGKRNRGFTQIYPRGWARLRELIQHQPTAARLYAFLAENIDDSGSVTAAQSVLADCLDVSEITIRRQTKWLEDHGAIVRIRVGNGVYAYALDPEEIWSTWDSKKDHAVFRTKTLVKKGDRENAHVKRKLNVMLRESRGEPELPLHDPITGEIT